MNSLKCWPIDFALTRPLEDFSIAEKSPRTAAQSILHFRQGSSLCTGWRADCSLFSVCRKSSLRYLGRAGRSTDHRCPRTFLVVPQVLHRLQNKEKPIRTTFTLRFGSLKMIFECSIARCDVGLGRAIVQCQKNPLRKPKLSINRAILSAHFSAVKFCIGFFCWIGFFLVLHRLFL